MPLSKCTWVVLWVQDQSSSPVAISLTKSFYSVYRQTVLSLSLPSNTAILRYRFIALGRRRRLFKASARWQSWMQHYMCTAMLQECILGCTFNFSTAASIMPSYLEVPRICANLALPRQRAHPRRSDIMHAFSWDAALGTPAGIK